MADVQPGEFIRATCKMTLAGEDVQNVYYYKHDGSSDAGELLVHAAIAVALDDAYDEIDALMTDDMTFDTIETYNVTQGAPINETAWPALTAGGAAGERMPSQVAALVTFPTGVRKSLGKKYLGVFTEAENDQFGQPIAALQTALAAFVTEVLAIVVADGENFIVGHIRKVADEVSFIAWVSGIVESIWATQRRRKKGTGS